MNEDELLYREMNPEDGLYMGRRGNDNTHRQNNRASYPSKYKNTQDQDGCLYIALILFIILLFIWLCNRCTSGNKISAVPETSILNNRDSLSEEKSYTIDERGHRIYKGIPASCGWLYDYDPVTNEGKMIRDTTVHVPKCGTQKTTQLSKGYVDGYDDGYEDGCNRDRGANYDPRQKNKSYLKSYKEGYTEGYYDGFQDTIEDF